MAERRDNPPTEDPPAGLEEVNEEAARAGQENPNSSGRDLVPRFRTETISSPNQTARPARRHGINLRVMATTTLRRKNCSTDMECVICMNDIQSGDWVRTPRCGHTFHCGCIERWYKVSSNCPVCRTPALKNPELVAAAFLPPNSEGGSSGALRRPTDFPLDALQEFHPEIHGNDLLNDVFFTGVTESQSDGQLSSSSSQTSQNSDDSEEEDPPENDLDPMAAIGNGNYQRMPSPDELWDEIFPLQQFPRASSPSENVLSNISDDDVQGLFREGEEGLRVHSRRRNNARQPRLSMPVINDRPSLQLSRLGSNAREDSSAADDADIEVQTLLINFDNGDWIRLDQNVINEARLNGNPREAGSLAWFLNASNTVREGEVIMHGQNISGNFGQSLRAIEAPENESEPDTPTESRCPIRCCIL